MRTIQRVDADLWQRITALSRDDLTRVLGSWLDRGLIDALLARRSRMMKEVEKLVARKGQALVIIK